MMTSPFPEIPGLAFEPIVAHEALDLARREHQKDPDGALSTNMSRLVWAYFNGSAGRQGPDDLGALQTAPGQRLLYSCAARAWIAEIPHIQEGDLHLPLDPDNLTNEWFELRHWFDDRKTSSVATPLVQFVGHIEGHGATPSLHPVDVRYPFQHIVLRLRIGRCLIVRETGRMADWLAACHEHGATALGFVQGKGEGPSGPATQSLEIRGATHYNAHPRLAILDFSTPEAVVAAWSAFTGQPKRWLDWN